MPPSNAAKIDSDKDQDVYCGYLHYQQLSATNQMYYGTIYTAVRDNIDIETCVINTDGESVPGISISLDGAALTAENISLLFESFYLDNPTFFFIDRTYSLAGKQINDKSVYDTLILQYTMNAEQRSTATQKLDRAVQGLLDGCPEGTDDYEKELYLHNQLLATCIYDQPATESSVRFPNAYSAYGALVEGKAVCEGYAKAMQLLLNTAKIDATVVRGYSADQQTAHMWNLVNINNNYYYLDPTWNDSEPHHHYSYFNITYDWLKRSHILDTTITLPYDCNEEADNYYLKNDMHITEYDRDAIADAITAHIQSGATDVHLRFEDGKYENGLLFLKNATLTKKMVNARLSGDATMWDYELRVRADQNTISLYKK